MTNKMGCYHMACWDLPICLFRKPCGHQGCWGRRQCKTEWSREHVPACGHVGCAGRTKCRSAYRQEYYQKNRAKEIERTLAWQNTIDGQTRHYLSNLAYRRRQNNG